MYDVFILGLMIVGILTVAVFSYKIFHSRVYPIGMVREIPVSQEHVGETSGGLSGFGTTVLETDLVDYVAMSSKEIATELHLPEHDVKDYLQRVTGALYAKRRLGLESGKQRYKLALHFWGLEQPSYKPEAEEHALEKEVVEHSEALEFHSKRFEEFEKRIRRLEVESVQKLQETTEEKPQPPLVVH